MTCYGPITDRQYEIVFPSMFEDKDRSRESKERHPDFEFPDTERSTVVSDKDVAFFETQDLYYKTYFKTSFP